MEASPAHGPERLAQATFITIASIIVNIILGVLKVSAGVFTGNHALLADGIHSVSDLVSDLITLITVRIGARVADSRMHYGYRRVETAGALMVSFMLVFAGIELVSGAFNDPLGEARKGHEWVVALVALLSVVAKEVLFQVTWRLGIRQANQVLVANAWHHRSDAVSSIAVLISVFISLFFPGFAFVDAIATVLIAGMILHAAWEIGSEALKELIDLAPSLEVAALVESMAERIAEVTFIHAPRIRTMGGALFIELNVEVDPAFTIALGHDISTRIRREITRNIPGVIDVSVHLVPQGEYLRTALAEGAGGDGPTASG